MLLMASVYYQIKHQPFYDDKLNKLEIISLCVQIGIIYLGLFYQSGKNDDIAEIEGFKWMVFTLIMVSSIYFAAIFAANMRLEMLKATVRTDNSFWFKLFSCGRIKDKQQFIEDNKVNIL